MSAFIRTAALGALIVICLGTYWTTTAHAAIPNSDNPGVYLEKHFRADFHDYNIRTMSGAYLEVGEHDPKWDALAVEYLNGQADSFTNQKATDKTSVPEPVSDSRMKELTRQLIDLGCTDPMVNYVSLIHHVTRDEQGSFDEAYIGRLWSVYEAVQASAYPINRKLHSAWRFLAYLQKKGSQEEIEQVERVWIDLMCQAITDPHRSLADQYYLFRAHQEVLVDDTYLDRWAAVCQRIDVPEPVNPWLVGMICGMHNREMAWKWRGNSYANKVTEEGWRGFKHHLKIAYPHLVKAWHLHPELPDTAAELIVVSMGLRNDEERMWFDRAVEARFDHPTAYWNYRWSIRPRWGGSSQKMYQFGVECLETGRFDTAVPSVFFHTMMNIYKEEDDLDFWRTPGVYENFLSYFDGEKTDGRKWDWSPAHWETCKAAVAWHLDRFEEGAAVLDGLGESLEPTVFAVFWAYPVLSPSECFARARLPESVFTQTRKLWGKRKYRRAMEVYDQVIAEMQPDDPARAYLRHRSIYSLRLSQRRKGIWINLLNEPDLYGWRTRYGDWSADDQGRIIGLSDEDGLMLQCRFNMRYRFQVKGTMTFLDDEVPEGNLAGLLLAFRKSSGKFYHRSVLFDPNTGETESAQNFGWRKRTPADAGRTVRFHLQMWDKTLRLTVNDHVIYEGLMMREDPPDRKYSFAIGGRTDRAGVRVRFDELKAKRLTLKPDWVPAPAQPGGFSKASDGSEPITDRVANSAGLRYKTPISPGWMMHGGRNQSGDQP